MIDVLVGGLLVVGAVWMFIAALGAVRMPDLPTRMHATTKAGALGAGLMLAAVAIHFAEPGITARALAVVAFIILTAPVAAHVIGRAGYAIGVQLWEGTIKDDLQGRYDAQTRILHSESPAEGPRPAAGDSGSAVATPSARPRPGPEAE